MTAKVDEHMLKLATKVYNERKAAAQGAHGKGGGKWGYKGSKNGKGGSWQSNNGDSNTGSSWGGSHSDGKRTWPWQAEHHDNKRQKGGKKGERPSMTSVIASEQIR